MRAKPAPQPSRFSPETVTFLTCDYATEPGETPRSIVSSPARSHQVEGVGPPAGQLDEKPIASAPAHPMPLRVPARHRQQQLAKQRRQLLPSALLLPPRTLPS